MKIQQNILRTVFSMTVPTLATALLLASCVKAEMGKSTVKGLKEIKEGSIEVILNVSGEATTKTTISQDDPEGPTYLPVKWKSGDKLYVVGETDGYIGYVELTEGEGTAEGTFIGKLVAEDWETDNQTLHIYYLGDATPTITSENKFTFDISSQDGSLETIASSGHISHASISGVNVKPQRLSATMNNMNAIVLYDLSEWTSGVSISGTYNSAELDLVSATFTGTTGDIAIPAENCTAQTYVTIIPDPDPSQAEKSLTFKQGTASTPTKANKLEAGRFYSDAGNAIKIAKLANDDGTLPGLFSVSRSTQVYFSKGNLQYLGTGDGTKTPLWRFAEHQYDIMGDGPDSGTPMKGNVTIDGYTTYNTGSQSAGGSETDNDKMAARDLFGWGATGFQDTRSHTYQTNFQPYSTSTASVGSTSINKYGYGPDYDATNKYGLTVASQSDWGYCIGGGTSVWRTLSGGSNGELKYLLDSRTGDQAPEIGTKIDARYVQVKVNGIPGLLIFPDVFTWPAEVTTKPTTFNETSSTWNSINYSTTDFAILESAGCVFLPTSGNRTGATIASVHGYGYYWSSTGNGASNAYMLFIGSSGVNPNNERDRHSGYAVRLVKDNIPHYIDDNGDHGEGIKIGDVIWAPVNCEYDPTNFPYGKLYQWGRKTGEGYASPEVLCTVEEGPVSADGEDATKHYTHASDWLTPQNNARWNSAASPNNASQPGMITPVKTGYDPCPPGWRIPTYYELDALRQNKSTWTTKDGQNGYYFSGGTTYSETVSRVFLPAAGYRGYASGSTNNSRTSIGSYWSSTVSSTSDGYAYYLYTASGSASMVKHSRAYALPIRCVYCGE